LLYVGFSRAIWRIRWRIHPMAASSMVGVRATERIQGIIGLVIC
jgi:hypothetical protein